MVNRLDLIIGWSVELDDILFKEAVFRRRGQNRNCLVYEVECLWHFRPVVDEREWVGRI